MKMMSRWLAQMTPRTLQACGWYNIRRIAVTMLSLAPSVKEISPSVNHFVAVPLAYDIDRPSLAAIVMRACRSVDVKAINAA